MKNQLEELEFDDDVRGGLQMESAKEPVDLPRKVVAEKLVQETPGNRDVFKGGDQSSSAIQEASENYKVVIGQYNQQDQELEEDEDENQQLSRPESLDAQPADLQEAQNYRKSNMLNINQEPYPIISTTTDELGKYGVGLQLYFVFLKQFSILFGIISLISIWPIIENSYGDYMKGGETRQLFDILTLANQYGISPFETNLQDAEDKLDEIKDNSIRVILADFLYTLLFIGFLVYYQILSQRIVNRHQKEHVQAADFSVQVKGLPEENVSEEELIHHFKQFGDVMDVYIARKYDGMLNKYSKRAKLQDKVNKQKFILRKTGRTTNRKLRMLQRQLDKYDQKFLGIENNIKLYNDQLPVERAYITFNQVNDRKACIKLYRSANFCKLLRPMPENFKFRGQFPITVKAAPNPSTIIWENLEIPSFQRLIMQVIAFLTCCIALIISAILIYQIKSIDDDLPTYSDCQNLGVSGNLSIEEAQDQYKTERKIYCYCKRQSFSDLIDDNDIYDFCEDYVNRTIDSTGAKFGFGILILLINFFMKYIARYLTRIERVTNLTKFEVSAMTKLLWVTFINMTIVVLLVNADFSKYGSDEIFGDYFLNGKYDDFNRDWYITVGSVVTATLLLAIFAPQSVDFLIFYPVHACRRQCTWHSYKTQFELNQLYKGRKLSLSTKLAQILVIIASCFLYSGGMPLLNIICFVIIVFTYWKDKILILRYYARPPRYGHKLNEKVISQLYWVVLLHCVSSILMYGSSDIFPTDVYKDADDGYVKPEYHDVGDKLALTAGVTFILLMLLLGFVYFFNYSLVKGLKRLRKSREVRVVAGEGIPFEEVRGELQQREIASYKIVDNPEYVPIIANINMIARKYQQEYPEHRERIYDRQLEKVKGRHSAKLFSKSIDDEKTTRQKERPETPFGVSEIPFKTPTIGIREPYSAEVVSQEEPEMEKDKTNN